MLKATKLILCGFLYLHQNSMRLIALIYTDLYYCKTSDSLTNPVVFSEDAKNRMSLSRATAPNLGSLILKNRASRYFDCHSLVNAEPL